MLSVVLLPPASVSFHASCIPRLSRESELHFSGYLGTRVHCAPYGYLHTVQDSRSHATASSPRPRRSGLRPSPHAPKGPTDRPKVAWCSNRRTSRFRSDGWPSSPRPPMSRRWVALYIFRLQHHFAIHRQPPSPRVEEKALRNSRVLSLSQPQPQPSSF